MEMVTTSRATATERARAGEGGGRRLACAAATLTHVGLKRRVNEDSVLLQRPEGGNRDLLAVVADGMGGHGFGDVASRIAAESVQRAYRAAAVSPAAALRTAVEVANAAIYRQASVDPRLRGMGTTCTAMVVRDDEVVCAHVGDSRLYLARGGGLYQMTEDHSQVRGLVSRGLITAEEARVHDERNVLLRALGTQASVEVSTWEPIGLRDGDRLLLCTDGLHGLVADAEIAAAMAEEQPETAAARLVDLALARGGDDNVSVIVVFLTGAAS